MFSFHRQMINESSRLLLPKYKPSKRITYIFLSFPLLFADTPFSTRSRCQRLRSHRVTHRYWWFHKSSNNRNSQMAAIWYTIRCCPYRCCRRWTSWASLVKSSAHIAIMSWDLGQRWLSKTWDCSTTSTASGVPSARHQLPMATFMAPTWECETAVFIVTTAFQTRKEWNSRACDWLIFRFPHMLFAVGRDRFRN